MKLFLVRHATATDGIGGAIKTDAERPLIQEGRAEAEVMAKALKKMGVKPDAFLHSPLVRTRQTAEIFAEVFGDKSNVHACNPLAPGGEPDHIFAEIAKLKRADQVFLFGHMPDIAMLAAQLLGYIELDIPFKKCAVCRIDVFSMPPHDPGSLKFFLTPRMVSAIL